MLRIVLKAQDGYLLGSPYVSEAHLRHFQGHPTEAVREFAERALRARGLPVG